MLIEGLSLAGGPDNQVHFEGYQVSNQCMALVRDECLLPCKDAPELGYAKESSSEQYVPDVFYKVKTPRYPRNRAAWRGRGPVLDSAVPSAASPLSLFGTHLVGNSAPSSGLQGLVFSCLGF